MMKSPRVLVGLLRYKVNSALGRHKVPFGFDATAGATGHGLDPGRRARRRPRVAGHSMSATCEPAAEAGHPQPRVRLSRRQPGGLAAQPVRPGQLDDAGPRAASSSAAPCSRWCTPYAGCARVTRSTWRSGSRRWSTCSSPSRRCTSRSGSAWTSSTASSSPTTSSRCSSCGTGCRSTSSRSTRRSASWPTRWSGCSGSSGTAAPWSGRSLVAFVCQVFYEIFDQLGPQLKWWAWNDANTDVNHPALASVPMNSMLLFASVSFGALTYLVVQLAGSRAADGGPRRGWSLTWRIVVAGVLTPLAMGLFGIPVGRVRWRDPQRHRAGLGARHRAGSGLAGRRVGPGHSRPAPRHRTSPSR